jgi:DNA-binding YbaB/EbfC family protein
MDLDITKLLEQAKVLQSELENSQKKLETITTIGSSGADMVTATINGAHKMLSIKISDELINIENKKMLEDLVVAAVNNAIKNITEISKNEMQKVANFPGLPKFPL